MAKSRKKRQSRSHLELSQLVKRAVRFQTNLPQELCSKTTTKCSMRVRLLCEREVQEHKPALPPDWKFVNKYQNRHSGGIPIFSEERLQERREKVRLMSNIHVAACPHVITPYP